MESRATGPILVSRVFFNYDHLHVGNNIELERHRFLLPEPIPTLICILATRRKCRWLTVSMRVPKGRIWNYVNQILNYVSFV